MTAKKKICCIGECMVELSPSDDGMFRQDYAGDTYTSAVYMKRYFGDRLDVAYITALGNDPHSDRMVKRFQSEGLITRYIQRIEGRSPGLYMIENDESGERSFQYWRSDAAARFLFDGQSDQDLKKVLQDFDMVYLSGITLAIMHHRERLLSVLETLKGSCAIAFDPNFRAALWPDMSLCRTVFARIGAMADTVFVTPEDEMPVWGPEAADQIANRWLDFGAQEVIVKHGADGCRIYKGNAEPVHIPVTRKLHPVDTTGAGDSFSAGYLAARLLGSDIDIAARKAHDIASAVIMHPGAIIPSA